MRIYKHLHVVGTSHVAAESLVAAEKVINRVKPAIVAIELDKGRHAALRANRKTGFSFKDIKRYGFKGWVFGLIAGFVERYVGSSIGVAPGSEMLHAAKVAHKQKLKVALIDQPLDKTLQKFSSTLTWTEKWRFFVDTFRGPWIRKEIGFAVDRVPDKETVKRILQFMSRRYPNVYKSLVVDRNRYMAKQLYVLLQHHTVVAIVGAGHEDDIVKDIKLIEKRVGAL